jgi:hypothetical protein
MSTQPHNQGLSLLWPFLGKIPEAAWIGNRQTTDFVCHIQQVFVARGKDTGLRSSC